MRSGDTIRNSRCQVCRGASGRPGTPKFPAAEPLDKVRRDGGGTSMAGRRFGHAQTANAAPWVPLNVDPAVCELAAGRPRWSRRLFARYCRVDHLTSRESCRRSRSLGRSLGDTLGVSGTPYAMLHAKSVAECLGKRIMLCVLPGWHGELRRVSPNLVFARREAADGDV